eukprot:750908-Prorocentrum_minimum.AAC.1
MALARHGRQATKLPSADSRPRHKESSRHPSATASAPTSNATPLIKNKDQHDHKVIMFAKSSIHAVALGRRRRRSINVTANQRRHAGGVRGDGQTGRHITHSLCSFPELRLAALSSCAPRAPAAGDLRPASRRPDHPARSHHTRPRNSVSKKKGTPVGVVYRARGPSYWAAGGTGPPRPTGWVELVRVCRRTPSYPSRNYLRTLAPRR